MKITYLALISLCLLMISCKRKEETAKPKITIIANGQTFVHINSPGDTIFSRDVPYYLEFVTGSTATVTYDVGDVWYGGIKLTKYASLVSTMYAPSELNQYLPPISEIRVEANDNFENISYTDALPVPYVSNYPDTIRFSQSFHLSFINTKGCGFAIDTAYNNSASNVILVSSAESDQLDIALTDEQKTKLSGRDSVYVRIFCQNYGIDNSNKYPINSFKYYSYRKWVKLTN
jgi:hypothetical protein